jgi:hypothetical protein
MTGEFLIFQIAIFLTILVGFISGIAFLFLYLSKRNEAGWPIDRDDEKGDR